MPSLAVVDQARVYVNGSSNGGGMTVRIGCDAADQVTTLGLVAGAIAEKECNPSRPVPMLAFHGTADPIVAYEGGEMEHRSTRHAHETTNAPSYLQGAEVALFTIDGGGHTWSGGFPIPLVGSTTKDIDATEEMWRFFQRHRLDGQP